MTLDKNIKIDFCDVLIVPKGHTSSFDLVVFLLLSYGLNFLKKTKHFPPFTNNVTKTT